MYKKMTIIQYYLFTIRIEKKSKTLQGNPTTILKTIVSTRNIDVKRKGASMKEKKTKNVLETKEGMIK
jgi:hypothetical protein